MKGLMRGSRKSRCSGNIFTGHFFLQVEAASTNQLFDLNEKLWHNCYQSLVNKCWCVFEGLHTHLALLQNFPVAGGLIVRYVKYIHILTIRDANIMLGCEMERSPVNHTLEADFEDSMIMSVNNE